MPVLFSGLGEKSLERNKCLGHNSRQYGKLMLERQCLATLRSDVFINIHMTMVVNNWNVGMQSKTLGEVSQLLEDFPTQALSQNIPSTMPQLFL